MGLLFRFSPAICGENAPARPAIDDFEAKTGLARRTSVPALHIKKTGLVSPVLWRSAQ